MYIYLCIIQLYHFIIYYYIIKVHVISNKRKILKSANIFSLTPVDCFLPLTCPASHALHLADHCFSKDSPATLCSQQTTFHFNFKKSVLSYPLIFSPEEPHCLHSFCQLSPKSVTVSILNISSARAILAIWVDIYQTAS